MARAFRPRINNSPPSSSAKSRDIQAWVEAVDMSDLPLPKHDTADEDRRKASSSVVPIENTSIITSVNSMTAIFAKIVTITPSSIEIPSAANTNTDPVIPINTTTTAFTKTIPTTLAKVTTTSKNHRKNASKTGPDPKIRIDAPRVSATKTIHQSNSTAAAPQPKSSTSKQEALHLPNPSTRAPRSRRRRPKHPAATPQSISLTVSTPPHPTTTNIPTLDILSSRLPTELLTHILTFVLSSSHPELVTARFAAIDRSASPAHPLIDYRALFTSRRIYALGLPLYYRLNVFSVDLAEWRSYAATLGDDYPASAGLEMAGRCVREVRVTAWMAREWAAACALLRGFVALERVVFDVRTGVGPFTAQRRRERELGRGGIGGGGGEAEGWAEVEADEGLLAALEVGGVKAPCRGVWVGAEDEETAMRYLGSEGTLAEQVAQGGRCLVATASCWRAR